MYVATKSKKLIEDHEDTIYQLKGPAREYMDEIIYLKETLEE
jgi:hypothetical protein